MLNFVWKMVSTYILSLLIFTPMQIFHWFCPIVAALLSYHNFQNSWPMNAIVKLMNTFSYITFSSSLFSNTRLEVSLNLHKNGNLLKENIRGAGTHGDMRSCPNHTLKQSLENVKFFDIVPTKFKTKLFLSPASSNTLQRHWTWFGSILGMWNLHKLNTQYVL